MAVRYLDGEVTLLWARPDDGYDVVVVDDGPERVYVRFTGKNSRSHVYAEYEDGQPTQRVVERGRDDDDRRQSDSYEPRDDGRRRD